MLQLSDNPINLWAYVAAKCGYNLLHVNTLE